MPQGSRPAGAELARRDSTTPPLSSLFVLLLGHGCAAPGARARLEALVAALRGRRPGLEVGRLGVEGAAPRLADGLGAAARCAERVVVLPVIFRAAGDARREVADPLLAEAVDAAQAAYPWNELVAARPLDVPERDGLAAGAEARLAGALEERLAEVLGGTGVPAERPGPAR